MTKRFHLGWFCNFSHGEWNHPFASGLPPWDGKIFVEMAQAMERACFDYLLLEDTMTVSEAHHGTAEATLRYALHVPKHDPVPLAAMIAAQTRYLGVVATMSTMAYPPFSLARLAATLDHIAGGRFGWNIVNSAEDAAAQNFGMSGLPPQERRDAIVEEYVELVCRLFDSWGSGAVVMDRERGIYADHAQVRPVHFEGEFFKCRGPLNTVCSPQGRPVFVQPNGSSRRRDFAARTSDSIVATANGLAGMRQCRDDVRAHATMAGRDPDDIKVLFLVYPVLGETREEAWAKYRRMVNAPDFIQSVLASIGRVTGIDFSRFDLDRELPRLTANGEQEPLDKFAQWGSGKTLRQLATGRLESGLPLVGTPDQVAAKMEQAMEAIGGDGFLISAPFQRSSRRVVMEVTEGLVPALQRRGLVRTAYTQATLRDTLREF